MAGGYGGGMTELERARNDARILADVLWRIGNGAEEVHVSAEVFERALAYEYVLDEGDLEPIGDAE